MDVWRSSRGLHGAALPSSIQVAPQPLSSPCPLHSSTFVEFLRLLHALSPSSFPLYLRSSTLLEKEYFDTQAPRLQSYRWMR